MDNNTIVVQQSQRKQGVWWISQVGYPSDWHTRKTQAGAIKLANRIASGLPGGTVKVLDTKPQLQPVVVLPTPAAKPVSDSSAEELIQELTQALINANWWLEELRREVKDPARSTQIRLVRGDNTKIIAKVLDR